jgi:2-polyprenyl-6-methoxyphenol hydroxylase-like FAD-dependent oxidoreductase
MDPAVLDDTPEMIHNIPQPQFEQLISEELSKTDLVEVRKNVSFVSCHNQQEGVETVVEDRTTGDFYAIRSRHVIACDGAKSKVRTSLGVESEGEDSYETMMTIEFNADLRPIVKDNVGILHWVMDPAVSGFIIGYDLSKKQVLICNIDPKRHPLSTWNESLCRKTLNAAIGREIPFEVRSFRPWILSRKVAKSYRVGNVFLAGDAAHSFPPTGGLGLNSGLADVHNLAYKIAAVHHGWAGESLLDTYEGDRRHVAEVNSRQSVKNGKKIFSLLKSLGTTDTDTEKARSNLFSSIHDPEKRKEIDAQVKDQQEHFDNVRHTNPCNRSNMR